MNVIINVPSQQNILFTLDELMVVIMVREKKTQKLYASYAGASV